MTIESDSATARRPAVDAVRALLGAIDALRNGRALLALLGCSVAGLLVMGLTAAVVARLGLAAVWPGFVALVVGGAVGINSAGILLLEQVHGHAASSLKHALRRGLSCVPATLGLVLLAALLAVMLLAGIALVYLLCKTPVLGPLAFALLFPLSVVVVGLAFWSVCAVLLVALPAVWSGATFVRSVALALAVARLGAAEALLLLAGAGLVAGAVGLALVAVLIAGLVPTIALAAAIFGDDALGWVAGLALEGTDRHGLAAGIGGGMLWALSGSLVALVALQGLNIVHLRVTAGRAVRETGSRIEDAIEGVMQHAAGWGRRARRAVRRLRPQARDPAPAAAGSPRPSVASGPPVPLSAAGLPEAPLRTRAVPHESTAPSVTKALTCAHCLSAVAAGDRFCATCGHTLP